MPYIKQEPREALKPELDALKRKLFNLDGFNADGRAGILNYLITDLLDTCYGPLSEAKYKDYNEAIGMLECCKLEFYRKAAAPYEDMKAKENGTVLDSYTKDDVFNGKYDTKDDGTDGTKGFGLSGEDLTRKHPIPKCCADEAIRGNYGNFGKNTVTDEYANFRLILDLKLWIFINGKLIKPYKTSYDVLSIDKNTGYIIKGSSLSKLSADRWNYNSFTHMTDVDITCETFKNLNTSNYIFFTDDEVEHMITNRINFKFMEAFFEVGIQRFINTRGTDLVPSRSAKSSSITKVSEESVQSFTSNGKINITKRNLIFSVKVNLDTTIYIRANSISDADHIFDQIEPYKDGPRDYNVLFVSHFVDLDKDLKTEFRKKEISGTPEDSLYIIVKKVIGE